jgi:hypothetical protein
MRVERWSIYGFLTGAVAGFIAILNADYFLTGLFVGMIWLFLVSGMFAVGAMFFDYVVLDYANSPANRVQEFHFSLTDFEVYTLAQYHELERVISRNEPEELEKISGQISRKIGRKSSPKDPKSFLMSYYIQFRAYLIAMGNTKAH